MRMRNDRPAYPVSRRNQVSGVAPHAGRIRALVGSLETASNIVLALILS